jgi:predicted DNA-binding transcriptional regulator AlpA
VITVNSNNLSSKTQPETPCLAMRPRETAKALGISERLLWDWTNRGEVPHIRVGKAILYPVDVLRRWLDEQAAAGKEVPNDTH